MLWEFEALDGDVEGGGVSVAGIPLPPLHHLDGFGLRLGPGRRAEELEAELTVHVQHAIGSHQLAGRHRRGNEA